MPKAKRKVPLLASSRMATTALRPTIKKKERRRVITTFHNLLKEKEAIQKDVAEGKTEGARRLGELKEQIDKNLAAYQAASVKGQKFSTSKWVMGLLSSRSCSSSASPSSSSSSSSVAAEGDDSSSDSSSSASPALPPVCLCTCGKHGKPRLFDIGALTHPFAAYASKLQLRAIDLNSLHPDVEQRDFFTLDPRAPDVFRRFDAIVLSLVINFVGTPEKRGEMLVSCREMLRPGGSLFLVLPLPCLDNSRYLSYDMLLAALCGLGFRVLSHKKSKKLAFFEVQRVRREMPFAGLGLKAKKVLFPGVTRNDFTIVIPRLPAEEEG